MKYNLGQFSQQLVEQLTGEFTLHDEIALYRLTIQDLLTLMETQPGAQRMMMGSMIRDAIEGLSRIIDRAARLPQSAQAIPVQQVAGMLNRLQATIQTSLPDGPAKDHLITALSSTLGGISVRESPTALVLRTCEMMDRSVPYVEDEDALESTGISFEDEA